MIAKFEFEVTVHYSLWGKNAPSCDPLTNIVSPDDETH